MVHRGILDIPFELLIQILKLLQLQDLLHARATCRILRDVVKRSLELQYIIELAADSFVDGPRSPGSLTTAARLELLLDRRRRWRCLDWAKLSTVSLSGTCQAYEMVDGVFAKSMGGTGLDGWAGSKHLIMTWLPSRTREAHSIVREDLGVASRDFAIDPTQDLIALVDTEESIEDQLQIKVHLRTMSQNASHPLAAKGIVTATIPFQVGSCFVQIVDDVVGMFFWVHGPGFVIWNWKTGEKIVERTGFELPLGTWDFAFISSRAFILTSIQETGSIELFTFDASPGSSEHLTPTHVASLQLPPLQIGQTMHSFTTHSAPFLASNPTSNVPFYTAQDDRIHAMSLRYGDRGPRILLIVKNSALMNFIPTELNGVSNGMHEKVVIPWGKWGPQNTRFLDCTIRSSWLRYVHGQRIVLPEWAAVPPGEGDEEALQTVCVMDFNAHPSRIDDPCDALLAQHDAIHDDTGSGTFEEIVVPAIVPKTTTFVEDVVTYLPYIASTRTFSADYTGFMIDQERLVGMKSMAFAESGISSDRDIDIFVF